MAGIVKTIILRGSCFTDCILSFGSCASALCTVSKKILEQKLCEMWLGRHCCSRCSLPWNACSATKSKKRRRKMENVCKTVTAFCVKGRVRPICFICWCGCHHHNSVHLWNKQTWINKSQIILSYGGGGGFFLGCEDYGGRFDNPVLK